MSTNVVPLFKGGPSISRIGLGLMGLCIPVYGATASDEGRFKVLDKACELGCTHWDLSDFYGDSEELVGKWFKRTGKRKEIFLATKFGFLKGSQTFETDSSAQFCKDACKASLRALDVEYIDLYYLHHANSKTPIEETMRALAELKAEGKIKHIGLSSISSTTLRRAVKIAPVAAVQTDYSAFFCDIENESGTSLLATCRALGIPIVAAMPLGRGMITPSFAAGDAIEGETRGTRMPRFLPENIQKNREVIAEFKKLADKAECSTAQLALAWLLKQGHDIFPIPGTRREKYLIDNWESQQVEMTDGMEAEIRRFADSADLAGDVIPAAFRGYYYADTAEEKET